MSNNGSFLEKLTLGEIGFIEDKIGMPMSKVEEASQSKFLIALVMVYSKRQGLNDGRGLSLTEASALSMDEVNKMLGLDITDDEDEAENADPLS
jgi:hypothetical protein